MITLTSSCQLLQGLPSSIYSENSCRTHNLMTSPLCGALPIFKRTISQVLLTKLLTSNYTFPFQSLSSHYVVLHQVVQPCTCKENALLDSWLLPHITIQPIHHMCRTRTMGRRMQSSHARIYKFCPKGHQAKIFWGVFSPTSSHATECLASVLVILWLTMWCTWG